MFGQDAFLNATQQQLVSRAISLAAHCIHWPRGTLCGDHSQCWTIIEGSAINCQYISMKLLTRLMVNIDASRASDKPYSSLHAQVYLHNNGSVTDVVFELSCPALNDDAGLQPVFLAQMPAQDSQPGPTCAPILICISHILCQQPSLLLHHGCLSSMVASAPFQSCRCLTCHLCCPVHASMHDQPAMPLSTEIIFMLARAPPLASAIYWTTLCHRSMGCDCPGSICSSALECRPARCRCVPSSRSYGRRYRSHA